MGVRNLCLLLYFNMAWGNNLSVYTDINLLIEGHCIKIERKFYKISDKGMHLRFITFFSVYNG